jgi:hypothetical protein
VHKGGGNKSLSSKDDKKHNVWYVAGDGKLRGIRASMGVG